MGRRSGLVASGLVVGALVLGGAAIGRAEDTGDAQAGAAAFKAACVTCHGETGKGDGPIGQKLKDKPTDWSAGGGGLAGMTDQQIFDVIAKGGKAAGKAAAMPGYPKLSEAEVWNLVAHVKTLKK
jgi:mono/diheme cytochrome c family protein